ncbi:MAG: winged helix-turn-helix transcriptional regulator [Anaerolineales bacterium]
MTKDNDRLRQLRVLEEIEQDPDTTQADLATRLGVAVGTVNWHLKRLVAKGYVKVKRAERKKLRYFITREGLALRARLTLAFVENSLSLYRETRDEARRVLLAAKRKGYQAVWVQGNGDLAEICRLTCLELGVPVVRRLNGERVAILQIEGRRFSLKVSETT